MRVSKDLLTPVYAWAESNCKKFKPNGQSRQYGVLQRADLTPPAEVWEIKKQIVDCFRLENAIQEPSYKDFCGYITHGGAVYPHRDEDQSGMQHVRFNVLVSKPEMGGMPVQDGVEIIVDEGDVWRCNANIVRHWCTRVIGSKPRIVLSYGFLI